jgi:hypothetical protein
VNKKTCGFFVSGVSLRETPALETRPFLGAGCAQKKLIPQKGPAEIFVHGFF